MAVNKADKEKSIIKALEEYFKTCPLLKSGKIRVDDLGEKPVSYSIEPVPSNQVIKKYTDGATLRQYIFVIASREYLAQDAKQQIENSEFFEKLSDWIEEQNKAKNLPKLEDGKLSQRIDVLTSGYLMAAKSDNGRYQIQMRLVYYRDR